MTKNNNGKKLPTHLTKGGPGDVFKGGGSVDTSTWFHNPEAVSYTHLRAHET